MDGGFWYADRSGRLVPVVTMDNGADPFNDGLARSRSGNKIGFIDRKLHFAVDARYDGAYPFERGRAVVCTDCIERRDASGEHGRYEDGLWGCIDTHGREVVQLKPMKRGDALLGGGCGVSP